MGADKSFSMEDLKGADTREKALLVIHGKVYDVGAAQPDRARRLTCPAVKFLDEHPGGDEVLLGEAGGKDASEAFEDVGHSDEAREIMDGLLVGTCSDESLKSKEKTVTKARVTAKKRCGRRETRDRMLRTQRRWQLQLPVASCGAHSLPRLADGGQQGYHLSGDGRAVQYISGHNRDRSCRLRV